MISLSKSRKTSVPAYSALAQIYDHVMSHVDYTDWANYLVEIIEKHNCRVDNILELSCGTGTLSLKMANKGFHVLGCDKSLAMVQMARNKTKRKKNPQFICSEMSFLPVKTGWDGILSLYDSMNYMLNKSDWIKCFNDAYSVLNTGGIFVFDVSTVSNSVNIFQNYVQRESFDNAKYLRKGRFDKKKMIQKTSFEIQLKEDPNIVYCEIHEQRIRELADIEQMIKQSPLNMVGCYFDFSFDQGDENAERVHYVLQKQD